MDFTAYIKPELLVIIPVLNLLGAGIKKNKSINDKYIPVILGVMGLLIAGVYTILTSDLSTSDGLATAIFTGITQGLLCAAGSVYANQIYKQTKEEE